MTLLLISAASVPGVSAATTHDAIAINGNSGFTSANGVVSGTGTDLYPYIIEGWSISDLSSSCITIRNTDAHFIIRDCVLELAGIGPHITLDNVTNGRIEGNAISNNGNGISLSSSSSNTITNNTFYSNGIYLSSSSSNVISGNTISCTALGISLSSSSNSNTITNNTVTNALFDIIIANSNNNVISGNTVTNASSNGIRIYSSSDNEVTWNALLNNSINAYDATDSSSWDFNLYSDYTGPDNNNDGIGDIPYNITGGSRQDPHPIVLRPPAPDITSFSPANASVVPGTGTITAEYSSSSASINASACLLIVNSIDVTASASFGTSGMSYSYSLPSGACTVALMVADASGSTWCNWSFTVDATPPEVQIVTPANATYADGNVPINVSASDAMAGMGIVLAEVDGTYNVTLVLQGSFYVNDTLSLPDGHHVIRIFANDTMNNMNSTESVWFTVDTTPPEVVIISPANTTYTYSGVLANVSVADSLSPVASVLAEVDGLYNLTLVLQGGYYVNDTMLLEDGHHLLRIFANDSLGNTDSSQYVWFTVDTTPPEFEIISPANTTYPYTPVVNASVADALSGVGSVLAEVDGLYNLTLVLQGGYYVNDTMLLEDGMHQLRIFVNDTVGNSNSSSAVWFTVDTTPPEVVIISPANASYAVPSIAINASVIDATSQLALVLAEVDGAYNLTLVLQGDHYYVNDTMLLEDGHHVIRVFAADIVGNTNSTESVWFLVDTTPPEVVINSPENTTYPGTPSINVTVADAYSPVDAVLAEVDGTYNLTLVLQGDHYYVNDT
ncbi:MAG TPA: NosD domain-containing protein, partial [Candidatus Methanomethylicus sp.]|nr:NosD domain-containing protein [Candidatus Methanomethylicus sp.]